jgi:anaerobic selenocysteine-containing dehydrogenase
VRTTCPYCGVGCGLIVQPHGDGGAEIAGDPAHPANFARICLQTGHTTRFQAQSMIVLSAAGPG